MSRRKTLGDKIAELETRLAREVEERRKYAQRVHELENLPEISDADRLKRLGEVCDKALELLGLSPHGEDEIVPALERIREALNVGPLDSILRSANNLKEIEKQAERSDAECDAAHDREAVQEKMLDLAREDRKALLKHAKLTEREWYMLGGVHPAHL